MAREIINLDDNERFPPFDKLPSSHAYCIVHCMKNVTYKFDCALNDAKRLKKWMFFLVKESTHIKNQTEDEQFRNFGYFTHPTSTNIRCLSIGSNSEGVDETDNHCL